MEKSILIFGPQASGKTTKAKEIIKQFKPDEVVHIPYQDMESLFDDYLFSQCTEKTKLVVFDELSGVVPLIPFYEIMRKPIVVNKKGDMSFTISPKFLVVLQTNWTADYLRKNAPRAYKNFEVIQCPI